MTKQRMIELRRPGQRKTLIPVVIAGEVRHLVHSWLRFKAERFVARLARIGVNATIGGKWIRDDKGCHFQATF